MEYWNGGQKNEVLKPIIPLFHHSIIPIFQYSNFFPLRAGTQYGVSLLEYELGTMLRTLHYSFSPLPGYPLNRPDDGRSRHPQRKIGERLISRTMI